MHVVAFYLAGSEYADSWYYFVTAFTFQAHLRTLDLSVVRWSCLAPCARANRD